MMQMLAGALGIPVTGEGSGTSWLPDATPMYAVHGMAGPWELILMGNAFLQYIDEGSDRNMGPLGSLSEERKTFSTTFRPAGDGLGHVLGELETQVMEATWAIGRPATVREVLGRLDRDAGRAYNTVMTVMVRLTDKGLLQRAKHEGVWHYQPTLGEAEFRERVSGEVLRGLLQLAPEATLSQLVELLAEDDPGALDDLLRPIAARRAAAAAEEAHR